MVAKIKCQLKECLRDHKDDLNLTQQNKNWGSSLDLQFQKLAKSISLPKVWQIRATAKEFQGWIANQQRHSLFFDGVAKGNLGRVGVGGVILNPDGIRIHNFAWGLGIASNIQVEALALFQGLKLLKVLNIREANVIGDSQVIIKTMVSHSKPMDLRLARVIFIITDLGDSFQNLNFYHVLRANNKEADIEANKAALLTAGALLRDRQETWDPIP